MGPKHHPFGVVFLQLPAFGAYFLCTFECFYDRIKYYIYVYEEDESCMIEAGSDLLPMVFRSTF